MCPNNALLGEDFLVFGTVNLELHSSGNTDTELLATAGVSVFDCLEVITLKAEQCLGVQGHGKQSVHRLTGEDSVQDVQVIGESVLAGLRLDITASRIVKLLDLSFRPVASEV